MFHIIITSSQFVIHFNIKNLVNPFPFWRTCNMCSGYNNDRFTCLKQVIHQYKDYIKLYWRQWVLWKISKTSRMLHSNMHSITNLWKFGLNHLSSKLRENNMEEKTPLSHKLCAFRWLEVEPIWGPEFNSNILVRNYFFFKNYVATEGAVSHNVVTINNSPMLPSHFFMLTIILSDYPSVQCL